MPTESRVDPTELAERPHQGTHGAPTVCSDLEVLPARYSANHCVRLQPSVQGRRSQTRGLSLNSKMEWEKRRSFLPAMAIPTVPS
jgi:hypothetical protein